MQNLQCTFKRNNGTDYDILLPTTVIEQIYRASDSKTLETILGEKEVASNKGIAGGYVPLNAVTKIDETYLPSSVFGGLRFTGYILDATKDTTTELDAILYDYVVTSENGGSFQGLYFIVTVAQTLTCNTNDKIYTDDGILDGSGVTELGVSDIVLCTAYTLSGDPLVSHYTYAIIHNEQDDATTAIMGLVKLSDQATVVVSPTVINGVITNAILYSMMGTATGKIAWGNHTHSYQPLHARLTEIAGLTPTDNGVIIGNGSNFTLESGSTLLASLGLTIGSDIQAYNAALSSLANMGTAADKLIYSTAVDTFAESAITASARSLLAEGTVSGMRDLLGLEIGVDIQAYSAYLAAIVNLAKTDGNFIVGNGTTFVAESGATARASLSVYSAAEVDSFLTNRPEIYYDTVTGAGAGDIIIDLD